VNRLVLNAQVVERKVLRYTPAGLPALDLRLAHASQVEQAGSARQVSFEMPAVAIGEVARSLEFVTVGATAEFTGFLAKQRSGRGVVFHIQSLSPST
jgi:primosomal replication protein N